MSMFISERMSRALLPAVEDIRRFGKAMAKAADRTIPAGASVYPPPPTPAPPKLNTDRTVAVSTDVFWNEDMENCPRGCKVQLLGAGGVAVYGLYDGRDKFWVGWQAVPRRKKA